MSGLKTEVPAGLGRLAQQMARAGINADMFQKAAVGGA